MNIRNICPNNCSILAIPGWYLQHATSIKQILEQGAKKQRPPDLPVKDFTPKVPQVPKLPSYHGDLPPSYWQCWPRNDLDYTPHPWIDPVALQQLATSLQYPDLTHVNYVAKNLTNGWRIGATGAGRLHAIGHNLSSFFEHGYKEWIPKMNLFPLSC